MPEKVLRNDLQIQDETREANAGFKLTEDYQNIKFTWDTKVIPALIAGIKNELTNSTATLLTAIQDNEGNNRLTTQTLFKDIEVTSEDMTGSGSQVLYQAPQDKDFYLCYALISVWCDNACNLTQWALRLDLSPTDRRNIITIIKPTTTAHIETKIISFATPIKLPRNKEITMVNSFTLGNAKLSAVIGGYLQ